MKKEKFKYTPKYFKDNLPDWKRKKDSIMGKILYRPVSFLTASLCAKLGISANTVSYFSILVAIATCVLFIIPNSICNIVGGVLFIFWIILDCTDGNLARCVKKQPFGEFADAVSSYILVALLCSSIGFCAYFRGGILINPNCIWIVLFGVLASTFDTLMRLVYQKYLSTERKLADEGIITIENDKRNDEKQVGSLIVFFEHNFGTDGILPILSLLAAIFNAMDLLAIYCFCYYFMAGILMILKYIYKAIKRTKEIESKIV